MFNEHTHLFMDQHMPTNHSGLSLHIIVCKHVLYISNLIYISIYLTLLKGILINDQTFLLTWKICSVNLVIMLYYFNVSKPASCVLYLTLMQGVFSMIHCKVSIYRNTSMCTNPCFMLNLKEINVRKPLSHVLYI